MKPHWAIIIREKEDKNHQMAPNSKLMVWFQQNVSFFSIASEQF